MRFECRFKICYDTITIIKLFHIVEEKPGEPGINSRPDSQYSNVAIITFDDINQFGGMWAKKQLDLTLPFHTKMFLHLGHEYNKSGRVADGMTFTMHNDPDGLNPLEVLVKVLESTRAENG